MEIPMQNGDGAQVAYFTSAAIVVVLVLAVALMVSVSIG